MKRTGYHSVFFDLGSDWDFLNIDFVFNIGERSEPENFDYKISRCVCETRTMPPAATKSKKAIFRAKVKVKVTRSLTLVSFERVSLVKYACQI